MKEEINLLPPAAQKSRWKKMCLGRIGHLLRLTIALLFILILVVVTAIVVLKAQEEMWESVLANNKTEVGSSYDRIKDINNRFHLLEKAVGYQSWSVLLVDVLRATPDGIRLTEMSFSDKSSVLTIRGVFTDRETVVAYQQTLEGLPWVKKLEAPLSNFATGAESRFTFTISRK